MRRLMTSMVALTVLGLVLALGLPAPDWAIGSAVGLAFILDLFLSRMASSIVSSHTGARRAVLASHPDRDASDPAPLDTGDVSVTKESGAPRRPRGRAA